MGAAVGFVGADGFGRTVSPSDPLPVSELIPPFELQGLLPDEYDEFERDRDYRPTEIVFKLDGVVVATVLLVYGSDGNGGLIGGSIVFPEAE